MLFHMKMFMSLLLMSLLTLDKANQAGSVAADDAISNHIRKCCVGGLKRARTANNCDNYQNEVMSIPPLWLGLCHSTFGLCCSREIVKQICTAGRLAALEGSRCDEKNNATTAYGECCRACQVGLAVKASGGGVKANCNDPLYEYFNEIESYRICCGNENENSKTTMEERKEGSEEEEEEAAKNVDGVETETRNQENHVNGDGTIVLVDDDDICGKVQHLCAHICENTKEAYQCKCRDGYRLDANNVTCSLIVNDGLNDEEDDDDDDVDDVDEVEDSDELTAHENAAEETIKKICEKGYQLDLKHSKCIDIDECALKLDNCKSNQCCHNSIGSYHCLNVKSKLCEPGYEFDRKAGICKDVNECDDSPCEFGHLCVNYDGHYKCKKLATSDKCDEGFIFKDGLCKDINECEMDENACDSTRICTNDVGGYHCDCKLGFNYDTTTNACVDINECSINNHNCLPTQRCDNTVGSYICTRLQSCGTGYTLNAETGNCDDDDECTLNTHNCTPDYDCFNTKGSFRCYRRSPPTTTTTTTTTTSTTTTTTAAPTRNPFYSHYYANRTQPQYYPSSYPSRQTYSRNEVRESYARPCDIGFQRNYLGACVDINECHSGTSSPCGSHQRCINSNGSYRCQNLLQCPAGYRSNPEGTQCNDVNECETGEHNCANNQICHNRLGGYVCSCPTGHQLSTRMPNGQAANICVDIDECAQDQHPAVCPSNAQCVNTLGSYYCECKSGFQKSRDNDRMCLDVDECQTIPGLCQQKCVNFWGGYRCTCNPGYELSYDNRTCNDVDECEVHKSYKLCMGFCNNVPGSYECSCPRGYTLAMDRTTCRDIDECASGDFCTGRHDICTNIRGSYRCTTIQCPYGYINDPDQKNRCRQASNYCEGDDCYNKPSAYTFNFITLVSKLIIPPEGRTIFTLTGPLWYDDIDFDLKIVKIQADATVEKASDNHFDMIKGKHDVKVSLKRSLEGPQDVELELSMTVFRQGLPRGKSVAKIFILVSQYTF